MKKTNLWGLMSLLLVLMMGLSFTSCSDDDDDDNSTNSSAATSIVGSWTAVSYDGDFTEEDKEDLEAAMGAVYTFNEDGTGSISALGLSFPFAYTKSGNKLAIEGDMLEGDFEIVKLTSNELSLKDLEDGVQFNFNKK